MTTTKQRTKRLQEFVAHDSNVNCLALGHISGRVLVTGGYDRKVNLWAIGADARILSLNAHSSPIECVKFGHTEEYVGSGSQTGELNIWDLEASKKTRNFSGHKDSIKCMDFHPYGDFLASGSLDTSIKLWDVRRKGCISSYRGHTLTVNKLRFSPDGIWLVSAGDDGLISIWDIRNGKRIAHLRDHEAGCQTIELHPHEFLMASGGSDRMVLFWDLERFQRVSGIRGDMGAVRSLRFSPGGECLFAGVDDAVYVLVWEPGEQLDVVHLGIGPIHDMVHTPSAPQLITASYCKTKVRLSTIDLKHVKLKRDESTVVAAAPSAPMRGVSTRKSFSKEKLLPGSFTIKRSEDASDRSGPDTETDEPFMPQRTLNRTPPPKVPSPPPPVSLQPLSLSSLDDPLLSAAPPPPLPPSRPPVSEESPTPRPKLQIINSMPRSPSPRTVKFRRHSTVMEEVRKEAPTFRKSIAVGGIGRGNSVENEAEFPIRSNSIRHSPSEPALSKQPRPRKASLSDSIPQPPITITPTTTVTPFVRSKPVLPVRPSPAPPQPSPQVFYTPQQSFSPMESCGVSAAGVGVNIEDFLPKHLLNPAGVTTAINDEEVLTQLASPHNSVMLALTTRQRTLHSVSSVWRQKDLKMAIEYAIGCSDRSVLVDVLQGINGARVTVWSLDVCAAVLTVLADVISSPYETHATVACDSLKVILRNFADVIRTNVRAPVHSVGTDISREERYKKSLKCQQELLTIRTLLLKKQTAPGPVGATFRELLVLMENLDH